MTDFNLEDIKIATDAMKKVGIHSVHISAEAWDHIERLVLEQQPILSDGDKDVLLGKRTPSRIGPNTFYGVLFLPPHFRRNR